MSWDRLGKYYSPIIDTSNVAMRIVLRMTYDGFEWIHEIKNEWLDWWRRNRYMMIQGNDDFLNLPAINLNNSQWNSDFIFMIYVDGASAIFVLNTFVWFCSRRIIWKLDRLEDQSNVLSLTLYVYSQMNENKSKFGCRKE